MSTTIHPYLACPGDEYFFYDEYCPRIDVKSKITYRLQKKWKSFNFLSKFAQ